MHGASKLIRTEELLRLLLVGNSLKECATQIGMSYYTIRKYASAEAFMNQLRDMSATIYERVDAELKTSKETILTNLEKASEEGLIAMRELVKGCKNDSVRMKAAQDLMDRDGRLSRTKKIEGTTQHGFMNPLTLVHAAKVAKETDEYNTKHNTDGGGGEGGGPPRQLEGESS